jgi:cytochrome c-type biogenesis protein CcmH
MISGRLFQVAILVLLPSLVFASAIEPLPFANELEERRFRHLAEELRCTVCQNQSLADSDAPLAQDLRRELFMLIRDGRSDFEIREFMVSRYGEFVLYRPPLAAHTILLWAGPIVLLLGSLIGVVLVIRRRRQIL